MLIDGGGLCQGIIFHVLGISASFIEMELLISLWLLSKLLHLLLFELQLRFQISIHIRVLLGHYFQMIHTLPFPLMNV